MYIYTKLWLIFQFACELISILRSREVKCIVLLAYSNAIIDECLRNFIQVTPHLLIKMTFMHKTIVFFDHHILPGLRLEYTMLYIWYFLLYLWVHVCVCVCVCWIFPILHAVYVL